MIAVAGHLLVDASQRDAYVEAHRDLVSRARAAAGCIDLCLTADSVDPARVDLFELWATQTDLDAWRARADGPDTGIEILDGTVREYVIDHDREAFSSD